MNAEFNTSIQSSPLVVVLDDDIGLARLLCKRLKRDGFRCVAESEAEQALELVGATGPDLLVVDHRLGGTTGEEFIGRVMEAGQGIPFIMITGQGDERIAVQMMKKGALDYVVKDSEFLELIPIVVRRALEHIKADRRVREAEQALRRSEANLAKAQELSRVGSFDVSLDGKEPDYWSRELYRILGVATDAAPLRPQMFVEQVVHPDDKERALSVLERSATEGVPIEHEFRIIRQDGTIRYLQSVSERVLDHTGVAVRLIGTVLDITERKQLQQQVLEISEQERNRIGHDLHDGLCQHLAGIELMCHALEQEVVKHSKASARQLSNIVKHVRQAIHHTRALARGFSPVAIEDNGLMVALQDFTENIREMFKVDCVFECPRPVAIRENAVAAHLFRIAQEAVSNSIKHGRAKKIEIRLARLPQRIILGVHDDGSGISSKAFKSDGMGLRIMQYRADVINGSLVVQKNDTGGTTVACTVRVPDN